MHFGAKAAVLFGTGMIVSTAITCVARPPPPPPSLFRQPPPVPRDRHLHLEHHVSQFPDADMDMPQSTR